ncbi:MAG: hypothetical protein ACK55X_11095 [Synechococcaceae cyanobacterium]
MTQTLSRDPSDPLFQPVADSDPATPGDPLSRLRFHYGQCLSAEDFEAEQRYFVLRQRLHNALLHGVGTVWGLAIRRREPRPEGGDQLICDPGMAIDPLGREIWVPQPLCLDLAALEQSFWDQLQPVPAATDASDAPANPRRRAYVVLRYEACLSDAVPVIPLPCGDDHDGLAASRLRDSFRLCLEAEAPADPYATVRDISARLRRGGPPSHPRRGDRWQAPDGTVWIYEQPRNADGTYSSDVDGTLVVESALTWLEDRSSSAATPAGTTPGGTFGLATGQGWRQLLLEHALNAPIGGAEIAPGPLERFWSGADDAALLLATLDLEATEPIAPEGLQAVRLQPAPAAPGNPDNSVRAVLPAVQALADLAFGIRLEGPAAGGAGGGAAGGGGASFQVLSVRAQALDAGKQPITSGSAAFTAIEVRLNLPVATDPAAPTELAKAIRLLRRTSAGSPWIRTNPTEIQPISTPAGPALQILVQPAWASSTSYQVVLSGTGARALLSDTPVPQPLAGVAGEFVPPGSGRDAHLFGTYTPPPNP